MKKIIKGFTNIELTVVILIFTSIAAWITHVIHCLMAAKYLLLIVGGIVAPVGIIHGIGLWFGVSW